ncbi:hypothetical protein RKD23_008017 [Streptomyces sp. SAI-170]|uniref:hypothetical protein n=1 Tax=Streptomyces sp. SAI-170 TaxID=3377729 RepID=UPI003C7CF2A9
MFRPDRATLRSAGFVVLLTGVLLMVNSQVVYAASSNSETGDLLAPLNIRSSEGVPIDGYELNAEGGSILDFKSQSLAFALSGLFMLIRLLVGGAGWAIEAAFRFPLLKILTAPAQKTADTYNTIVVDTLGLKGLLLAWSFVFTGFMIVRGRVGRGLGEMVLTLLIAAFAASALIRPDTLLAVDGPLGQAQQVGASVAQATVNSYDWGGKLASRSPCDGMAGRQELKCLEREGEGPVASTEVARPLQDSLTNALIVKPYMLLQYGRILDPAKESDREAYGLHLKWISGGYRDGTGGDGPGTDDDKGGGDGPCSAIWGPAKRYCEADDAGGPAVSIPYDDLPAFDQRGKDAYEFQQFLMDLAQAGEVGKACAAYAEKPTWWRVGGALLLLVAALFIAGMILSSAVVLLGTQGACAAAAAAAGVAFVAAMLPGPARQSVWKWLSVWGIACLAVVGVCAFIPFFAIAVDATITDGPDLMVERMLLLVALAVFGTALHRRVLAGISAFGRRMAMRMRYARVGGTHLPGDTSELGAALAMNSPAVLGGYGGGLRSLTGPGPGRFGVLGTRRRLMGALASMADGAGMPVDTGRVLADATAEAGRGLAPLTAAAAVAGLGAGLGAKGGHWLLIGRRPDHAQLARWQRPPGAADDPASPPGPGSGPGVGPGGGPGGGGVGPVRPQGRGPSDRYRTEDGQIVDRSTGQVLHDDNTHRTLLATRAHNRLVRLRGYRIANRTARTAYDATLGLPATLRRARQGSTRFTADARQQVRVWGNTVREDARAWGDAARRTAHAVRDSGDGGDSGRHGRFTGRRLPTASPPPRPRLPEHSPAPAPAPARPASAPPSPPPPPVPGTPPVPRPLRGGTPGRAARPGTGQPGPVLPGGRTARSSTRDQARARFEELMRRTAADAENRRQDHTRQPEDGEDE